MTLAQFIGEYYGTTVRAPGGLGGECVDLANLFILDVYGNSHVYHNASDWAAIHLPGFSWTKNSPTNYPRQGDLVVWGADASIGTDAFGHIAIALVADSTTLVTLDQNWEQGAPVELVVHTYAGVLGWQKRTL